MPADPAPFPRWSYILGISGTQVGLVVASSSTNFLLSLGAVARTGGSEGNGEQVWPCHAVSEKCLGSLVQFARAV
jgi:hypothetical protein